MKGGYLVKGAEEAGAGAQTGNESGGVGMVAVGHSCLFCSLDPPEETMHGRKTPAYWLNSKQENHKQKKEWSNSDWLTSVNLNRKWKEN